MVFRNRQITLDVAATSDISFWYKVSSESNYDYLVFYIDGSPMGEWDGEVPWTQHTTTVSEGTHTFRWAYEKDYSVSNGSYK